MMRRLAGGLHWSLHTATGAAALLLMLGHAVWASAVLLRRDEHHLRAFHRISITVWSIWLIPFISGMLLGRSRQPKLPRACAAPASAMACHLPTAS